MGLEDTILKKYFSDKTRLADIFNYYCFNGREEIRAGEIETKDSVENLVISGTENKRYPVNRIRDVLASAERNGTTLLLLGIENQKSIHYGMPLRNLLYDAITYANQAEALAKDNRNRNSRSKTAQGEFLSGIGKGQKLKPVITLVLYYGKEPWDGPRTLADMLDLESIPEQLQPYIQSQYSLNLLEVRNISDYEKFHSDIRQVFQLLSCEEDKRQMRQLIEEDKSYQNLSYDAATAIAVLTSSKEIMNYSEKEREGKANMCKAIQDMIMDGREEGRQEGRKEGIQIFILDNVEENIPRERIYEKLQRRFGLTAEETEQYMDSYYIA